MIEEKKFTWLSAGAWLLGAIFIVLIGPLMSLWAWNVLFGSLYTIPINVETWFAASVLFGVAKGA
jgi:hypothetical protein